MPSRSIVAAGALCLLAAATSGARDLIPEPLLLDMVLPLGSERGTVESNVILRQPLTSEGRFLWVPEVEGAVRNGLGLELEVEFQDSRYTGWNFAGQGTLGRHGGYIHGVQGRVERDDDEKTTDVLALYVAGYRFNATWSALAIVGARIPVEADSERDAASVLNASLFAELSDRFVAAIETNLRGDARRNDELTVIPQIHYSVSDRFGFQTGLSWAVGSEAAKSELLLRLIVSF